MCIYIYVSEALLLDFAVIKLDQLAQGACLIRGSENCKPFFGDP